MLWLKRSVQSLAFPGRMTVRQELLTFAVRTSHVARMPFKDCVSKPLYQKTWRRALASSSQSSYTNEQPKVEVRRAVHNQEEEEEEEAEEVELEEKQGEAKCKDRHSA